MSKYGKLKLTVPKNHTFAQTPYGFQMSPYLQELVVFTGQNHVFEDASEQLDKLLNLEVPAKQIERVCHGYGQLLEVKAAGPEEEVVQKAEDLHYCMIDGGMVLTREDKWMEMKLSRVFAAKSLMSESEKRNFIKESTYEAHLGGCQPFFRKLEKTTDYLENMVVLADGATWIWNWANSLYPESKKILDYFHCCEHLHDFAKIAIKDADQRKEWTNQQEELLLNSETKVVIANISLISCRGKAQQEKRKLLTYYENNRKRMDYKTYQDEGLLIGSGPMEAAHRHVIQQRMKRSGQRWTIQGAQQMANLRVTNKSGNWQQIIDLVNLN